MMMMMERQRGLSLLGQLVPKVLELKRGRLRRLMLEWGRLDPLVMLVMVAVVAVVVVAVGTPLGMQVPEPETLLENERVA
jgi:hypothetical protein